MVFQRCPRQGCASHESGNFSYQKRGFFILKWSHQPIRRYHCKVCKRYFSSRTLSETYRQHKPYVNRKVFELYASNVTQRRMAKVLGVDRKTIVRKFLFLSLIAGKRHAQAIQSGALATSQVQFDEMESFEHTRLKPLTIPLAICALRGKIIDVKVGAIAYKGPLADIALKKYGFREDQGNEVRSSVLHSVTKCRDTDVTVTCDAKRQYPALIKKMIPDAHVIQTQACQEGANLFRHGRRRNKNDLLFRLNHIAAKIRHDLSRMGRKVWVTTKKTERLQAHLNLYIAYHNQYSIG